MPELFLCVGGPADGQYLCSPAETLRVSSNISPQLLTAGESSFTEYKRMQLEADGQPFTVWVPVNYTHYRLLMELMQGYKQKVAA